MQVLGLKHLWAEYWSFQSNDMSCSKIYHPADGGDDSVAFSVDHPRAKKKQIHYYFSIRLTIILCRTTVSLISLDVERISINIYLWENSASLLKHNWRTDFFQDRHPPMSFHFLFNFSLPSYSRHCCLSFTLFAQSAMNVKWNTPRRMSNEIFALWWMHLYAVDSTCYMACLIWRKVNGKYEIFDWKEQVRFWAPDTRPGPWQQINGSSKNVFF